ncbi:MAG: recombinase family protein [Comamonadaceae bacterium]|nr:recombinase family protein [Comamonadaceae bacterium]
MRQSTLAQVRHHRESTERQYALREKALALGWPETAIRTLDRDLGLSGAQMSGREDFKTLVADVSMGQVGAVFALEVSRLARSNLDWLRLLELCALTQTLVIDEDGEYDPADFNDGLLLGLKGTMAQAELHFCAGASSAASSTRRRRASCAFPCRSASAMTMRGVSLPIPTRKFAGRCSWCFDCSGKRAAPMLWCSALHRAGLRFPKRAYGGAWAGKLIWGQLSHGRVLGLLKNPSYAGVYVFGRYQYQKTITPEGEVHKQMRAVAMPDWRVHLSEHHEGYISVEEFEQNRQRLEHNRTNGEGTILSGPAREGLALLQGLLLCACCGRALTVRYQGNGGIYPMYLCSWKRRDGLATKDCISVRADLLDEAISEELFKALRPAEIELALAALSELEQRDQSVMHQWQMRIERAEYEAALAERRYEEADPSNRLVTATLERRWNEALVRLEQIKGRSRTVSKPQGAGGHSRAEGQGAGPGTRSATPMASADDPGEGSQAHAATAHPRHHRGEIARPAPSHYACPLAGRRLYRYHGQLARADCRAHSLSGGHRRAGA